MDTLGALALATEPPTDHLMHRTPVGRRYKHVAHDVFLILLVKQNSYIVVSVVWFVMVCFLICREPLITNIMWRNLLVQVTCSKTNLINYFTK